MKKAPNWKNSKYFGMTRKAIKEEWKANGKVAQEEGNRLHADIEEFYNGGEVDNDSKEFQQFKEFNTTI